MKFSAMPLPVREAICSFVLAATLLASLVLVVPAMAQVPSFVPSARYYGSATVNGLPASPYANITVQGAGSALCGSGYVYAGGGSYSVDIQATSLCFGALTFYVDGQPANQTTVLPNTLSGAVLFNLTVGPPYPYTSYTPYAPYASAYTTPPYTAPAYTAPSYSTPPPPFNNSYANSYALPYSSATPVTYQAGWNLVAGPTGETLSSASGSLFTFQPGDATYETLPAGAPLQAGYGYWAQFTVATTVSLPLSSISTVYRTIPPGQYALIGNPFGRPATVSGANAVFIYVPGAGYQTATLLQPGQAAWAVSTSGQVAISSI